jgi:hypothetical protein
MSSSSNVSARCPGDAPRTTGRCPPSLARRRPRRS